MASATKWAVGCVMGGIALVALLVIGFFAIGLTANAVLESEAVGEE